MKNLLVYFVGFCHIWFVTGQFMVPCEKNVNYDGPPLPVLPVQFQMSVEAKIVQKNMTLTFKEYYDYPGNRGMIEKYSRTNGERIRTVMDFGNKRAWEVFENNTCKFLKTNSSSGMLGFMGGKDGSHILTTKDLLYFGDDLGEVFVGATQVRGIPTNHWRTCVKIPATNGTFTLDYYFSDSSRYFVDGVETEIPVRAVINGTGKSMRTANSTAVHSFYHVYDFFDFKRGPVQDEELFEIPPGVVCNEGSQNTSSPVIPHQFSTSMQKIYRSQGGKLVRETYQLHVDYASKIFRIDAFQPLHPEDVKLYGYKPLSYIYDFNNGLMYIIDKYADNCTVTRKTSTQDHIVNPPVAVNDLFLDLSQFSFQGKKTLRNIPVLSWGFYNEKSKESIDIMFNIPTSQQKPNMIGDGIDSTPSVNTYEPTGIYKWRPAGKSMPPTLTVEHLFDFTSGHVDPEIFDVTKCYTLDYHTTYLSVDVIGKYVADIVEYHPKELVSKVRHVFANSAKVSPTRITSIKWEVLKPSESNTDPFLMVTFKMLDNKLAGLDGTSFPGPSLSEAVTNLQNAWQDANSNIQFQFKLDAGELVTLSVRAGSLLKLQPQYTSYSDSSSMKSYSPASMAGLGVGMLVLGAILGLLAAFVIYKRINTSIPYEISN